MVAFVLSVKSQCLLNFCFKQNNSWGSRMYNFVENAVSISEAIISREIQYGYKKLNLKYRSICGEFQRDGTTGSFYKDVKNWKSMSQILPTDFSFQKTGVVTSSLS